MKDIDSAIKDDDQSLNNVKQENDLDGLKNRLNT
jgi:hypothetical protein